MIPVVLSGGSGTRLWPVSRRDFPKQFNDILDESLLAKTLKRVLPLGPPRVVAVADTAVLTRRVLGDLDLPAGRAVFEPVGKNTAPAVALAVHLALLDGEGDEVLGIFPADHLITDEDGFRRAVRLAGRAARRGWVVTLGIRPSYPATGYGYVEVSDEVVVREEEGAEPLAAYATRGFREKPDLATAEELVRAGRFLWNSGMFVFRASTMAAHLERLCPGLWRAISGVEKDLSNLGEVYQEISPDSLDYAVMEKLDRQASIPCDIGWSDLGSWDEVARVKPSRAVFEHQARDNFVFGFRDKIYGFVGVDDVIVVDTADATLIAKKGASQGVKGLVEALRQAGERSAEEHVFEHRPWGSFEILRDTDQFKSKILRVAPHQRLSYQSHRHRAEHWVIVRGRPLVVLDDREIRPQPGEAVYVPLGAKHRIENPTDEWVEIVEVQLGSYFGEDDIIRYEDDYERV